MSIEDALNAQSDAEACAVCGKNVQGRGGFARINHGGIRVNLCCPLCLETFQKDPAPHIARLARVAAHRETRKLSQQSPPPDAKA